MDVAGALTMLFMAGCLFYWITRRRRLPDTTISGGARIAALLVIAFGLATLAVPLVRTSPAIFGRTAWPGSAIARELYSGQLRASPVALDLVASYLLLAVAAVGLIVWGSRKLLLLVSILGIAASSWALEMGHDTLFDWFVREPHTINPT